MKQLNVLVATRLQKVYCVAGMATKVSIVGLVTTTTNVTATNNAKSIFRFTCHIWFLLAAKSYLSSPILHLLFREATKHIERTCFDFELPE